MTTIPGPRPALFGPLSIVAIATIAALATFVLLPADRVLWLMSEEGPVEQLTSAGFWLAAAMVLVRPPTDDRRAVLAVATMLAAFAAREMDWHKVWTGTSVLRVSFYYGPAPLAQKIGALAALLPVIGALVWLAWRGTAPALRALAKREPAALTLLVFGAVMVASKLVDRSLNLVVEGFDWVAPVWLQALQLAIEETWELTLPVLAVQALERWRRSPASIDAVLPAG